MHLYDSSNDDFVAGPEWVANTDSEDLEHFAMIAVLMKYLSPEALE